MARWGILMFNLDLTCTGEGLIRPGPMFPNASSKVNVVHTWFFYRRKHLDSGGLPDTLNISEKPQKIFYRPWHLKKQFSLHKILLSRVKSSKRGMRKHSKEYMVKLFKSWEMFTIRILKKDFRVLKNFLSSFFSIFYARYFISMMFLKLTT